MTKHILATAVTVAILAGGSVGQVPVFDPAVDPFAGALQSEVNISARVITSHLAVVAGQTFHAAVEVSLADGWVYYSPRPGDKVKPATLKVTAPGLGIGQVLWPKHKTKTDPDSGFTNNVYIDRAIIYVPLTVRPNAAPGKVRVTVEVQGQICKNLCLDVEDVIASAEVQIAAASRANPAWSDDSSVSSGLSKAMPAAELTAGSGAKGLGAEATADWTLWTALGIALLAGLTLNIMPCVLPVIPLRILSIVELAGQSRRRFVTMGLAFAGGMLLFFAGIAVANIVLKLTVGRAFDLNQHFQEPVVLIVLAMIVVAMAANLFGVFNVVVPSKVAGMEQGSAGGGHLRVMGMGVMMGILATPCSFAYLVSALTWAQSQPLAGGTAAIMLIGVGMAAPHVLLSAMPGLVNHLPRPGRWMELFKQSSGFILLLVAVWLLRSLHGQDVSSYPYWVIAWSILFVMSLWIWSSWVRYDAPLGRKLIVRGIAVVLAVGSGLYMLPAPAAPAIPTVDFDLKVIDQAHSEGRAVAVEFDAGKIAHARQSGRVVLVKFTASWCTKCHMLDRKVFDTPEAAEAFAKKRIVYVKADTGRKDNPAAVWMRANGYGSAIPLTLVYPPTGEPIVARDFDMAGLIDMLNKAAGK